MLFSAPPSITYRVPVSSLAVLVISSTWATAAMLESASPRKPSEEICVRSSTEVILLVAWRRNASATWSLGIPDPLSVIRIKEIPPSLISTVIAVAPASIAFSTSSFTTEEGRSTTSPAAILSTVVLSNTAIVFKISPSILYLILKPVQDVQRIHRRQIADIQV